MFMSVISSVQQEKGKTNPLFTLENTNTRHNKINTFSCVINQSFYRKSKYLFVNSPIMCLLNKYHLAKIYTERHMFEQWFYDTFGAFHEITCYKDVLTVSNWFKCGMSQEFEYLMCTM